MKRFSTSEEIIINNEIFTIVEIEETINEKTQSQDFIYYLDRWCEIIEKDMFLESEYDKIRSMQTVR